MMFRGKPEEIAALKIGDTLFNFDGNRRVYTERHSPPVYEKHFKAAQIVGETKQSWVMDRGADKVNKKTLASACRFADRGYFTALGMESDIWLHDHRHKIVREIESVGVDHLKEIARIIGYRAVTSNTA